MHVSREQLRAYASRTPLALALERVVESTLMGSLQMERPILDLGCGDGIFASIAFGRPIDYGLDPNARELVNARRSGAYVHLLNAAGDSIPLPDESLGTVLSNSVLEHIPSLRPVLDEVHRVLRPGGSFVFTVPTDKFDHYSNINLILEEIGASSVAARFRRSYNAFWRHYNFMDPEAWVSLVDGAGFRCIETRTYNSPRNCRTNDLLVPLGAPGKLLKASLNRWVVSPQFRRLWLEPWIDQLAPLLDEALDSPDGGLLLVVAKKG